jgi:hypothetical protein
MNNIPSPVPVISSMVKKFFGADRYYFSIKELSDEVFLKMLTTNKSLMLFMSLEEISNGG